MKLNLKKKWRKWRENHEKTVLFFRKYRIIERVTVIASFLIAAHRDLNYQIREERMEVVEEYQRKKVSALERKSDSLIGLAEEKSMALSVLINTQISRAGIVESVKKPFWIKEFDPDTGLYRVVYLNPSYERLLPEGMSRFDLFGKTGHILDSEFGREYQKNDQRIAFLKEPEIVIEPFRFRGSDKIEKGRFLKGRVWEVEDKILIYGMLVEVLEK